MFKNFTNVILTVLLLFSSLSGVSAIEVSDFSVQHLTNSEGLCSQRIYSIKQTDDGAVWWASKNCVERYNGVSVKCYDLNAPVEVSYMAGHHWNLFLSPEGILYAFDNKGEIFEYDNISDSFFLKMDLREAFGSELILNDIYLNEEGLYVAAGHGAFSLKEGRVVEVISEGTPAHSIIPVGKSIYFCMADGVKAKNSQLIYSGNVISACYDEKNNNLWLGCFNDGVKVVSFAENGKVRSVTEVQSSQNPIRNPVRSICVYDEQTILLGVDGAGVFKASRVAHEAYMADLLFDANNGRNCVLGGNGVYSVLCDIWGGIIVGSYSGGIDIARPIGMASRIFRHQHNNRQTILNDHVNSVVQLSDGRLVMGTDSGVSIFDADDNQWHHSDCGNVIINLCLLSDGTLLAATYGQGVWRISADGQAKQQYSVSNGTLKDDYVFCIYEDRNSGLWMGCLDGQLVHLAQSESEYYDIHNVKDILQLPDGRVVVATASGIFIVDPVAKSVEELEYCLPDVTEVNKYACVLYLHADEELWIGTDGAYVQNSEGSEG